MHTEAKLVGEVRTTLGSLACRRLRRSGRIPGNLYGHGQEPVPFSVSEDSFAPIIRNAIHVVDIEVGGKTEKAIVKDVQWDTFGVNVKHFDLLRVDPDERVAVEVPLELRGTAPGVVAGGVMEYGLRSLQIECLAYQIPDHIPLKVTDLQLGQSIFVRDVELAPNMKVLDDPEALVVRVVQVQAAAEPTGESAPAQPELIGRKPAGEEE